MVLRRSCNKANHRLFLEAEAAQEAGMLVSIMLRPGNAPLSEYDRMRFTTWENFNQIAFEETKEANQKKLKAEEAI